MRGDRHVWAGLCDPLCRLKGRFVLDIAACYLQQLTGLKVFFCSHFMLYTRCSVILISMKNEDCICYRSAENLRHTLGYASVVEMNPSEQFTYNASVILWLFPALNFWLVGFSMHHFPLLYAMCMLVWYVLCSWTVSVCTCKLQQQGELGMSIWLGRVFVIMFHLR